MELKKEFLDKMKSVVHDYDKFLESYSKQSLHGLRLNTNKIDISKLIDICDFGLSQIDWEHDGYYYTKGQPGKNILHEIGCYYIQEPSAMSPIEQLDIKQGDFVLDLCAAPGGKSIGIATKLNNTGVLFSNEIISSRAKILSQNIERMGMKNVIVTNEDPNKLQSIFHSYFDKILVDAPCSGEGMFRKDENAINEWSLDNVAHCAVRSYDILKNAFAMLKVGGRLTYSTCTFSLEENEKNILKLLDEYDNAQILPQKMHKGYECGIDVDKTGRAKYCIRLYPHKIRGEGHFVATITKTYDMDAMHAPQQKCQYNKQAVKSFIDFANLHGISYTPYFYSFGNELYNLPIAINLDKIKVVRAGLHLGSFDKRFEPSHSLALAQNESYFGIKYDINEQQAKNFISGNTLDCNNLPNGWCLITYKNLPIGWGKVVGNTIKNHYPKGLRKQL